MEDEPQSSDLVDPLCRYSGIALFPRTFGSSTNGQTPSDPNDLDSINNFMKSMALRSPNKLYEKAKKVIDGGSDTLNSTSLNFAVPDFKNGTVDANAKAKRRERRTDFGRKRARFSLKPMTRQPLVSLQPNLDIDQLQDPEEYFLAHEKLENAKRELQRQKGGSVMGMNEFNPSTNARRRRPGILGKSVSYKHHSPMVNFENDEPLISSQEILQMDFCSPSDYGLQQETDDANVESQKRLEAGSIAKTEKKIDELLNKLLATANENLDGDTTLSLLHEHLQIKSIDLDKLSLPNFHGVGSNDFMPMGERSLKGKRGETTTQHKQVEGPAHSFSSLTPPKSPLAPLSSLRKHLLQSMSSGDFYSALNFDRHSDQIGAGNNLCLLDNFKSDMKTYAFGKVALEKVTMEGSDQQFDNLVNDNLSRRHISARSSGSNSDVSGCDGSNHVNEGIMDVGVKKKHVEDMSLGAMHYPEPDINTEDLTRPSKDIDSLAYESIPLEERAEDMLEEAGPSAQPEIYIEGSTFENLNSSQSWLVGGHAAERHSTTSEEYHSTHKIDAENMSTEVMLSPQPITNSENSNRPSKDTDSLIYGSNPMEERVEDILQEAGSSALPNINIDGSTRKHDCAVAAVGGHATERLSSTPEAGLKQYLEMHVEGMSTVAQHSSQSDINIQGSNRPSTETGARAYESIPVEEPVEAILPEAGPSARPDISIIESLNSSQGHLDRPDFSVAAVGGHASERHSTTPEVGLEQYVKERSNTLMNEQIEPKRPRHTGKKKKTPSHRQSLAAAGTFVESGVRRSSRIKSRPLEYWRGERLLYGRVHQTLTTVIGVKYISPGKKGSQSNFRVKSYVSDQYKELVDLAALH